jgi:cell division protein FtsZ
MIKNKVEGFEFISVNTDAKALDKNLAGIKILLGRNRCSGKGAEGNPKLGQAAVKESSEKIAMSLRGADGVFVVAGLGGGTGTGAAPEVARLAREMGISLTALFVTTPFEFEGYPRKQQALQGIEELKTAADLVAIFPNESLNEMDHAPTDFFAAFRVVDDFTFWFFSVLKDSVQTGGTLDKTFAQLKAIFPPEGQLWMGIARSRF